MQKMSPKRPYSLLLSWEMSWLFCNPNTIRRTCMKTISSAILVWIVSVGGKKDDSFSQDFKGKRCLTKTPFWEIFKIHSLNIRFFFKLFIYFALFEESARLHTDTPSVIHLNYCLSFVYWAFQPSKSWNCPLILLLTIYTCDTHKGNEDNYVIGKGKVIMNTSISCKFAAVYKLCKSQQLE